MSDQATYHFGPRDRRGVLLGLVPAQVAWLGAGLGGALLVVLATQSALVGLALAAAGAVVAFLPVGGRAPYAWVGPVAKQLAGPRGAKAPLVAHRLGPQSAARPSRPVRGGEGDEAPLTWQLPGLGRLRVENLCTPAGEVGLARLGRSRRRAFTLSLSGPRFGLAEPTEQARIIAAWGQVLGACAGSGLSHLQLTERVVPDAAAAEARWLAEAVTPVDPPVLAAYRAHVAEVAALSMRHQVFLTAVTTGSEPDVVAGEFAGLCSVLDGCGFSAVPLDASAVVNHLRSMIDPGHEALAVERAQAGSRSSGAATTAAPMAWSRQWGQVRTDGAVHACFEATELPRVPVGPDWAWPLVSADTRVRRTLALHIELAPPARSRRRSERAVLAAEGDEAVRARWGFRTGAHRARQAEAALAREAELADGYPDARFALLVCVSAEGPEELAAVCREVQSAAARAQVELRLIYGAQPEALIGAMPLGELRLAGGW